MVFKQISRMPIASILLIICCLVVNLVIFFTPDQSYAGIKPIDHDYFGMHIHRAYQSNKWWPSITFGSWRLWDANVAWPDLEPQKGKWNFDRLDKYIALAGKNNIKLLLPLGLSPQWASARPEEKSAYLVGNSSEPKDIRDWQNYVRTVATRYKGRIREYEIWNEPNLKEFYTGGQKELLVLSKEAYKIIKEVDPQATLVSPAVTSKLGLKWFDKYLALGGAKYCDVIGYHLYIPKELPEELPAFIASIKKVMFKYSVNMPLWNTESGWLIGNPAQMTKGLNPEWLRLSPSETQAFVARALLLSAANGVDRFYWYAWDNYDFGFINKETKQAHEGINAFAGVQNWLIGRSIDSCKKGTDAIWSCVIKDSSGLFGEVLWTELFPTSIPRTMKSAFSTVQYLNGSSKKLVANETISITNTPVLLKVDGRKSD